MVVAWLAPLCLFAAAALTGVVRRRAARVAGALATGVVLVSLPGFLTALSDIVDQP